MAGGRGKYERMCATSNNSKNKAKKTNTHRNQLRKNMTRPTKFIASFYQVSVVVTTVVNVMHQGGKETDKNWEGGKRRKVYEEYWRKGTNHEPNNLKLHREGGGSMQEYYL